MLNQAARMEEWVGDVQVVMMSKGYSVKASMT